MLKKLIAGAFICLLGATYAQTDAINAQKYWKFRNSFRQDFIKIGANDGEGIPAASRKFGSCIDNVDYVGGYWDYALGRWDDFSF